MATHDAAALWVGIIGGCGGGIFMCVW